MGKLLNHYRQLLKTRPQSAARFLEEHEADILAEAGQHLGPPAPTAAAVALPPIPLWDQYNELQKRAPMQAAIFERTHRMQMTIERRAALEALALREEAPEESDDVKTARAKLHDAVAAMKPEELVPASRDQR